MLLCHFAMIYARRMLLGVMAFVLILVGIAMHYAGWFETALSGVNAGWIAMLMVCYGMLYLMYADRSGRDVYFKALGLYRRWCWSEAAVHFLVLLPLMLLWGGWLCVELGPGGLAVAGVMMLFEAVFVQATFVSLQSRFVGLSDGKKLALMGVVSGPWVLTAWMMGMFASQALVYGQSPTAFVAGLFLLGILQTMMAWYE